MDYNETKKLEEFKEKYFEKTFMMAQENSRETEKMHLELRVENLKELRGYWINVMIFTVPVMVGVVSVINNSVSIIKNKDIAMFGLAVLSLILLIGVFYINRNLIHENRNLKKSREFQTTKMNEFSKTLLNCHRDGTDILKTIEIMTDLANKNKEESEKLYEGFQEQKKIFIFLDNHFSNIITYLFIGGIILIFFSLIG